MPKPAATYGERHVCFSPKHEEGPVMGPCEPTVLVGLLPAARYSDMVACQGVGGVDAITMGGVTVLIGKLPAARREESTSHPGIVLGGDETVLIGDPPPWVKVVRRGQMLVIVDPHTHTIRIVGVQEFHGDGASDEYVKRATETINRTWSGPTTLDGETYNVDCMVTGRRASDPPDPMANQINVKQTSDPPSVTTQKDPSNQGLNGSGGGYQHSTDADNGSLVPAHEFGHAMGLDDEYKETKGPNGERQTVRTGPAGGIMGGIERGARPTPANFNQLVHG